MEMAFKQIYTSRYLQSVIHVLFWSLVIISPYLFRNPNTWSGFSSWHYKLMINNTILAGLFYLNAYFLYPVLYKRKQIFLYIISLITLVILVMFLSRFIDGQLALLRSPDMSHLRPGRHKLSGGPRTGFRPDWRGWNRAWFSWYFTNFLTYIFITGISISYRIIIDNSKQEKIRKEKENENLKTELSFLRSQVSPHFIFNILNNMASMARKKSDMLEPSIIELSSLMRYMLYESDEAKVLLSREVEYLKSYIALQHLRFGDDVTIVFNVSENINAYYIEPMMLAPFVENAFKHGVGLTTDPQIDVALEVDRETKCLHFRVVNSIAPVSDSKDKSSGIGLTNVRRRLELLYVGKHSLEIINDGKVFIANLKIKLD
jgi:two-component system LytT family sensor kinase